MNQDQNPLITAINTVMVSFTQQIVEQATKPLLERIAVLEEKVRFHTAPSSFMDQVCNTINISLASERQRITKEVLDLVDERIKTSIASIKAEDISGLDDAIEEALQDQPPLDADDIDGLKSFVEGVIAESDADLDSTIREEVESQLERNDPVEKIKQALRDAADSL